MVFSERISPRARSCQLCVSGNQAELGTEMIIHFSGLKDLDKPGVVVSPRLLVCLECGFSQFPVPESALAQLAQAEVPIRRISERP